MNPFRAGQIVKIESQNCVLTRNGNIILFRIPIYGALTRERIEDRAFIYDVALIAQHWRPYLAEHRPDIYPHHIIQLLNRAKDYLTDL